MHTVRMWKDKNPDSCSKKIETVAGNFVRTDQLSGRFFGDKGTVIDVLRLKCVPSVDEN